MIDTKTYQLRYLPLFEEELNSIVDYIVLRLHNRKAALKLVNDVQTAIHERLSFAEAFEPYHASRTLDTVYYRIYVHNFIVFYVVIENVMEVRRILYNRRDYVKQLKP